MVNEHNNKDIDSCSMKANVNMVNEHNNKDIDS